MVTFPVRFFVRRPCHWCSDLLRCERARKLVCQMQTHVCTTLLDSQHPHSRSVDDASDAMIHSVPEPTRCILGGGSLLHRIPWQPGTTIWQNCEIACRFHHPPLWFSNYGVVFDGYEEESRIREEDTIFIQLFGFTADTDFSGKQEEFLSRDAYKPRLAPVNAM